MAATPIIPRSSMTCPDLLLRVIKAPAQVDTIGLRTKRAMQYAAADGNRMTATEAAATLFKAMPLPITASQLAEYGVEVSEPIVQQIAREILSLNLYWVLAAIDAHIPTKYRTAIKADLFSTIQTQWWQSGQLGTDTWVEYQTELIERCEHYARLVDQEGINPMGICAETAGLMEDLGLISSGDREKLLVLLIDYAPASEYGRLLENVG